MQDYKELATMLSGLLRYASQTDEWIDTVETAKVLASRGYDPFDDCAGGLTILLALGLIHMTDNDVSKFKITSLGRATAILSKRRLMADANYKKFN